MIVVKEIQQATQAVMRFLAPTAFGPSAGVRPEINQRTPWPSSDEMRARAVAMEGDAPLHEAAVGGMAPVAVGATTL